MVKSMTKMRGRGHLLLWRGLVELLGASPTVTELRSGEHAGGEYELGVANRKGEKGGLVAGFISEQGHDKRGNRCGINRPASQRI